MLKHFEKGRRIPLVFCAGQNQYFWDKFLAGIKLSVFADNLTDFNFEAIDFSGKKLSQIIDSANQLPAFSDSRLVVVDNFKSPKTKTKEETVLKDYVKNPSLSTVLVLKFKDGKIPASLSKAAVGNGVSVDFKDPYEKQIPYWVKEIASNYGKTVKPGVAEYFVNFVGTDLKKIDNEIAKLASYVGERKDITLKDVDDLVSDTKVETIFAFIDSLSGKNLKDGLRMLEKIIRSGEMPGRIIAMLSRHYRILWKVKKGLKTGMPRAEISSFCGISPYFLPKYTEHAKAVSYASLSKVISLLAKADLELKSINISKKLLIEKLCLDIANA